MKREAPPSAFPKKQTRKPRQKHEPFALFPEKYALWLGETELKALDAIEARGKPIP